MFYKSLLALTQSRAEPKVLIQRASHKKREITPRAENSYSITVLSFVPRIVEFVTANPRGDQIEKREEVDPNNTTQSTCCACSNTVIKAVLDPLCRSFWVQNPVALSPDRRPSKFLRK